MRKPFLPSPPYNPEPKQVFNQRKELSRTQIFDGDDFEFNPNSKYFFDKTYDGDDDKYFVVEYEAQVVPNPNYDKELEKYNATNQAYLKAQEKYQTDMALWKTYEAKQQAERERAEYERLKAKYG